MACQMVGEYDIIVGLRLVARGERQLLCIHPGKVHAVSTRSDCEMFRLKKYEQPIGEASIPISKWKRKGERKNTSLSMASGTRRTEH